MKKIVEYLILITVMMLCFVSVDFNCVQAEGEEVVKEEDKIVINPKSDGSPMHVYNIETKDENGEVTSSSIVQFTNSRDIPIAINFTEEELENYNETFSICEKMKTSNGNKEKCANYSITEKMVYFQLSSMDDGEKEIYVAFSGKNGYKKITKKIVLDTTGPVINLTEGEYLYIPLGGSYKEKGAVCTDDSLYTLGGCSVDIEEANIDMNKETYQYVRYTAEDFLGNESTVVRKVLVEIAVEESSNTLYWVAAGFGVAVLSALLLLQVWKNKEKQKNQSVL